MERRSPFTHILVPTDGSDTSVNASLMAVQIAASHDIPITFLYVVDSAAAGDIATATARSSETICQELENKGQHYLNYLTRLARGKGLRADQVLLRGVPYREISDFARERGIDLIVLGRVDRKDSRRVHIGRVAERIIEYAPCPILIVRHSAIR